MSIVDTSASHPFHRLTPRGARYATQPIADGFNWAECLRGVEAGQWYLVVFRSVRRATANADLLTEFDDHAHAEALSADGFLYYFKGELGAQRECLSFCLWQTRRQAQAALRMPRHHAAIRAAAEMYESYTLERYLVAKRSGTSAIAFRRLS